MQFRIICAILWLATTAAPTDSYAAATKDRGIVLVVASYNPDTQRMSEFIGDFESHITNKGYGYRMLIEDMGCKGLDEAEQWQNKLTELLNRYNKCELSAVILLGQEAWASFMLQKLPADIPFFGCFASQNGIVLPVDSQIDIATWLPESVDMQSWAQTKGRAGGMLNVYDVKKNIDLIKSLYPNTTNIAFLSDNTYGGLSLQALVRKQMEAYPELNLIMIDSRKIGTEQIADEVDNLPNNTALLLGTWRVDGDGMYFLNSSINSLLPLVHKLPIFTLTGTGLGKVAIGGYIPSYKVDAKQIADQIHDYHNGHLDSIYFSNPDGQYMFDKEMIDKLGIKDYQLPMGSVVVNKAEQRLRQLRNYVLLSFFVATTMVLFMIILLRMYYNNKKLKDSLIENEKQLIISKDKAEESGRLKSAFLANMSHEIRTPLNAIVGFSSLLCDESMTQESRVEFSRIIMSNSNMLLTLINDILDISRLETDKVVFDYRDDDLDAICHQVLSTTAHNKKPDVEYVYRPNPGSYLLKTDTMRLSQVLINLLNNANKFTDKGSITLGYNVERQRNMVYFYVMDTGCGIPLEKQSKVFNRFEKLDEYKQGTGLGLAICDQIIARFGGEIWVDSEYEMGAKFIFSLPIMDTDPMV